MSGGAATGNIAAKSCGGIYKDVADLYFNDEIYRRVLKKITKRRACKDIADCYSNVEIELCNLFDASGETNQNPNKEDNKRKARNRIYIYIYIHMCIDVYIYIYITL